MTERWLWTQKENFGPSPRYGHAMAYDAARQRVVLFGGGVPEGAVIRALNDTWEWDGSAWAQVADTGPSARLLAGMVYDDARQRLVLFGGSEAGGPLNGDTWEWDGEDWTQVADIGPTPRSLLAVAYDKVRRHVVLFGGTPTGGALYLNDTWAWDGTEWTQIADTGPSARISHAMVFDSSRECLVLFGGTQATMVGNDTWEWGDEAEWIMRHAMGPRDFRTPKWSTPESTQRSTAVVYSLERHRRGSGTAGCGLNARTWAQARARSLPSPMTASGTAWFCSEGNPFP